MQKKNIKLKTPKDELVKKYVSKFKADKRYYLADQAIFNLIKKFPDNKRFEDILLKVVVINRLYSTGIYNVNKMAEHIKNLNIDKAISRGDLDAIEKISTGHGINRKFYSFATKYCSFHNLSEYPIYDSFVEKLLVAYKKQESELFNFESKDLGNYKRFKDVLMKFRKRFNLSCSLKELDKFLFIYGGEKFPRRYKKSII